MFRNLFRRRKVERALDDELQSSVELLTEEKMKEGLPRATARRRALIELGGVEQVKEEVRAARLGRFLETLVQDFRYALRQLGKSPGFTAVAVLTLALGIGANTAVFTLVHGILLRSLPVVNPASLYRIGDTIDCCVEGGFQNDNGDYAIFSYDAYLHLKNSAPEFEQLAAVQAGGRLWSVRREDTQAKSLHGQFVSGNFFSMLGLGAYAGRVFSERDDIPSAAPVAVISYRAWQTEFNSDPSIVGSTIFLQAKPFTVAGIAPPGFFGDRVTDTPPDFWAPLSTEPYLDGPAAILHHADTTWLYPLGRLRPGTNIGVLQTKLSIALRQWLATRPNLAAAEIAKQHLVLAPGGGGIQILQQYTSTSLTMLMILSSFVLLIACANIANLTMARTTTRRAEVAVRMALGAGRRRVIRQILTESTLLSCLGGLAGLAVAYAGARVILDLVFSEARNLPIEATPSLPVLAFAFLVSLLTGVLFGVAPAWLASHAQPAEALRGANRSTRDHSSIPQKTLVVLQAALSVVLLTGAVLMTRSLINLEHQNFGIATSNRYVVHFEAQGAGYTTDRVPALYRQMEDRFSALPGISSVALALYSPLEQDNWGEGVFPQGQPDANGDVSSTWDRVSPRFLDAIGVPVLRGRGITTQDTASTQPVAIVNQTFAKRFFPNQDPVGRHFGIDDIKYSGSFEIVGVFADFKMNNPREAVRPVFLRPLTQQFTGYVEPEFIRAELQSMFINAMILSFNAPQQNVDALVRHTLAGIDPNITVISLRTYDAQVADNFVQERIVAQLSSLFGALALILASIGLYGVMSYFVARRTSEIGIRMALGATPQSVVAMVLRGALWQILIGLALGIPAALFAGHLMASQLYGVGSFDPLALVGATAVLGLCAAMAAFIPARRAASIEPMQALRME
jgi:predicted permease